MRLVDPLHLTQSLGIPVCAIGMILERESPIRRANDFRRCILGDFEAFVVGAHFQITTAPLKHILAILSAKLFNISKLFRVRRFQAPSFHCSYGE